MKKQIFLLLVMFPILNSCKLLWNLSIPEFTNDIKIFLDNKVGFKPKLKCSMITSTQYGNCIFKGSPELVNKLIKTLDLSQPRNPYKPTYNEIGESSYPIKGQENNPLITKENCEWMAEFNHQTPTKVYEYKNPELIYIKESYSIAFSQLSVYYRTDTNKICLQVKYASY